MTKNFLSKLETELYIKEDEIFKNLKILLYHGKTYEALEIVTILEKNEILPNEIVLEIAYLHYIKMQNSHLSPKTINEFISRYPEINAKNRK